MSFDYVFTDYSFDQIYYKIKFPELKNNGKWNRDVKYMIFSKTNYAMYINDLLIDKSCICASMRFMRNQTIDDKLPDDTIKLIPFDKFEYVMTALAQNMSVRFECSVELNLDVQKLHQFADDITNVDDNFIVSEFIIDDKTFHKNKKHKID